MKNFVHSNTPSVTVLDNRGQTVREIAWYRHPDTPQVTDERITGYQYDAQGSLTQSIDPRFYERQQTASDKNAITPNLILLSSLSKKALRTQSVDAGTRVALHDVAGRPVLAVSANGVSRTFQYESDNLPGRLLTITEQVKGENACITERLIWSGNTPAEKGNNLAGQCVVHYDPTGMNQTNSISLTSIPLSITQQLLKDDREADWHGMDESGWKNALAPESFTSVSTTDATGTVLTSTDAAGNKQRIAYDVAGLLQGSWLALKGKQEQVIVKSLTYSAASQKLREEHGNGIVTTYTYEPETQRVIGIKTERPSGHAAGEKILQNLRYEYDPVGNVLKSTNDAEITRFWRNQKIVPENTYTYDSLYQLVSVTGREMANIGRQKNQLPIPALIDNNTYTNYSRTYDYDRGGNLTRIRHNSPITGNNYTTNMTVSDHSNRAVLEELAQDPTQVDMLFTPGGHQTRLVPGQDLFWTPRDELQQVILVNRENTTPDQEFYRYDADSQRVIKTHIQKTGNSEQIQRTLYLPELEWRTTYSGNTLKEFLQVITVGEAGQAQVRVLHWETGKPADISNDQLRYSYGNLIGSSGLELDSDGQIISQEEYYPYGGTAVWAARSQSEADYKTVRYSGKERDATGLYYYSYRYYQSWTGRWLSVDPAGEVDGLNLFRMCRNNPIVFSDSDGRFPGQGVLAWIGKKAYRKAVNITTEHLLEQGASFDTFLKLNRGLRTFVLGVGVASLGVKAATIAGASPWGIVGAAIGGFVSGAVMGFFANNISEKIGEVLSYLTRKRSVPVQVGAFVVTSLVTSALFNSSSTGTAISAATAVTVGGLMALAGEHNTGMAISIATPAGQGTLDTLRPGNVSAPERLGALSGAIIGGILLGRHQGSSELGERAAIGAMYGARWGRIIGNLWDGPYRFIGRLLLRRGISSAISHAVSSRSWFGRMIGESVGRNISEVLLPYSRTSGEWVGAAIGGTAAAAHHAVGGEVANAASRVTWSGFKRAFNNFFFNASARHNESEA
ncbi:RHS repeat domain-containing protein [Xenorhabdus nematophila]|uniref:RHS repeat domain-containing protein n=1 Tax=Xenorhabdus nematophila TaxID=628 RepID=UPI0032B8399E